MNAYENIKTEIKDGVLTIEIVVDETKVTTHASKSGKSVVIATTGGATKVGFSKLNLTLYRAP